MLPSRNRIKPKAFFILKNFPKHKVLETEVDPLNKPRWASVTTQWLQKVKWSRYRPGVAQGMGRGIALLFHDRSTRRRWVVSSKPWPHFTSGKDPVPILQEAGWAPGSVWTSGKSRPHRDSIPDHPARSHSLYRIRYQVHTVTVRILNPMKEISSLRSVKLEYTKINKPRATLVRNI